MQKISKYSSLLKNIQYYISDSKKNYISRSDLAPNIPDQSKYHYPIIQCLHFNLISKTFLLHDHLNINENESRRIYIKSLKHSDYYKLSSKYYSKVMLKQIKNSIYNITDTKYIIVVSNTTYDSLLKNIDGECVYNFNWFQKNDNSLYVRANLKCVFKNNENNPQMIGDNELIEDDSKQFEEVLISSVTYITKEDRLKNGKNEYQFCIFKIKDILLSVLFPKYTSLCKRESMVNIWPLVPVSCVQNSVRFIEGLKVNQEVKNIFKKILLKNRKDCDIYKISNLRQEIMQGITLPQMLYNKISLNQIYIAYFLEFLAEHVHYEFASLIDNCASYIRCCHCNIIFDNIFGFIRHWWEYREKTIFRCHICLKEFRATSLSQLGQHFLTLHPEIDGNNDVGGLISSDECMETEARCQSGMINRSTSQIRQNRLINNQSSKAYPWYNTESNRLLNRFNQMIYSITDGPPTRVTESKRPRYISDNENNEFIMDCTDTKSINNIKPYRKRRTKWIEEENFYSHTAHPHSYAMLNYLENKYDINVTIKLSRLDIG